MLETAAPPREIIKPKDQEEWLGLRVNDITSTEIAGLFNLSPYPDMTPFALWHRKKNKTYVKLEPHERMKWGTRLQDSIAAGIAEDQGWIIRRKDEYMRDPILRVGSSFDFEVALPPDGSVSGLLEVKNVDAMVFRDGWIVDGDNVEAPPHIELQVQHQLLVSGYKQAHIGALIGGNKVVLIKREADPKIALAILDRVTQFWKSIEDNTPPEPNFQRDAQFIAKLYNFAEPNKLFDARGNELMLARAQEYRSLGEQIKLLDEKREELKAQILMEIGDAEKATGDGFSVTAGVIGAAHIEYDREPYRSFRINWKKAKPS